MRLPACSPMAERPLCIACSIFRAELAALPDLACDRHFLESTLHIRPAELRVQLDAALATAGDRAVVLLYGDCHPRMPDCGERGRVRRTTGINCCEILLGTETYRTLRRDGAFFLMPEWARRWREVFAQELGLDGSTARDFMREHHRYLLYLDTGLVPVPEAALQEFSDFCGLPWQVRVTGLKQLRTAVDGALHG